PGADRHRGHDVLPDGRHGDRKPLFELVHQPGAEFRRARRLQGPHRGRHVLADRRQFHHLDAARRAAAEPHRLLCGAAAQPASAGAGADALAHPLALGAARGGRGDPLAVHVRSAARADQFVPRRARLCRPSVAGAILDGARRGRHRGGVEGLSVLDRGVPRRVAERRRRTDRGGADRWRRASAAAVPRRAAGGEGDHRHQRGADRHPHLQLFRHDLDPDARRAAERDAHLPHQDLRTRLRAVPLRGSGDLWRHFHPAARRADPALLSGAGARPEGSGMSAASKRRWRKAGLTLLQVLLAVVILLPFFWMLSVSLKPATEPFAIPARLWPEHPTIDNYVSAFRPEFRAYFINSVIVSLSTVVITVTLALLAAYSFSRNAFRLLSVLLGLVIVAQMFPGSAIIIPIYEMMRSAHLLNTYAALIIAYVAVTLPVAIWMLRGFLSRLPLSLEEAAAIDGAGPVRAFFDIIVPLCRPGIAATAVFVLIVTWQEFLFALSFTSTKEMRTLPVGMNDFIGQYGIRYGELMASSVLISLPVVVIFMFLQRQFVAGLTAGAVKG